MNWFGPKDEPPARWLDYAWPELLMPAPSLELPEFASALAPIPVASH
jgi:hypothetical protein